MADRHTIDTITTDALNALYEQLKAAEETESQRQLATAREALASATTRAASAEAQAEHWLAFIERFPNHMQFSLLRPDGTTALLPCADWCYACRVENAEAAIARVRALAEANTAEGADGQPCDADTLWPSEILALLDEARPLPAAAGPIVVDNPRDTGWFWTCTTCGAGSGKFSTDRQAREHGGIQHPECPPDPNGPYAYTMPTPTPGDSAEAIPTAGPKGLTLEQTRKLKADFITVLTTGNRTPPETEAACICGCKKRDHKPRCHGCGTECVYESDTTLPGHDSAQVMDVFVPNGFAAALAEPHPDTPEFIPCMVDFTGYALEQPDRERARRLIVHPTLARQLASGLSALTNGNGHRAQGSDQSLVTPEEDDLTGLTRQSGYLRDQFAVLAAQAPVPVPTAQELADGATADKVTAQRIHSARRGIPLHHVFAVLQALRAVRALDRAPNPDHEDRIPLADLTVEDLEQLYDDLDRYAEVVGELNETNTEYARRAGRAEAAPAPTAIAWTPPPPGDTREQLPAHILALLDIPPYTSTACETAELLTAATLVHPEDAEELREWARRQRERCRINNKYTGVHCRHTGPAPSPAAVAETYEAEHPA
ncbi:hypothetical protein [Streptomyces prunicolor]|uniref:hypothetical protein n=1 Tax=Streptomyces prunicolor TaxID=67348 RepID=UPI00036DACBA|nr:hypothetical protein [Streptomyces prunicolor]